MRIVLIGDESRIGEAGVGLEGREGDDVGLEEGWEERAGKVRGWEELWHYVWWRTRTDRGKIFLEKGREGT